MPKTTLPLAVIICTFNRAKYLKLVLESFNAQTVSKDLFEIIIVDDGSSDNTKEVVESFCYTRPIKYFYQKNSGLASAKNHGIYAAQGDILLFFDDDDVATPTLIEEHLKTHKKYPENYYAVLNYTTWEPKFTITPLMKFVTEIGCFLFSYPHIKHEAILDYTNFWGGRSSCKRSFLIEHGVFNPIFRFGCEDIELGYRLSKWGLKVVYNANAISYMIRSIALDDFCKRLIKQGRSQYYFSTMYDDPQVHEWCETIGAEEKWNKMEPVYEAKIRSARALEKIAEVKLTQGLGLDELTERLLYQAYRWVFRACKMKGIVETKRKILHNFSIS